MNQWDYLNQRADELERALNAGRGNTKSLYDPQKPTLYEIQRQYAEDVKQLRQQFEESQRTQAKTDNFNRIFNFLTLGVAVASMIIALVNDHQCQNLNSQSENLNCERIFHFLTSCLLVLLSLAIL